MGMQTAYPSTTHAETLNKKCLCGYVAILLLPEIRVLVLILDGYPESKLSKSPSTAASTLQVSNDSIFVHALLLAISGCRCVYCLREVTHLYIESCEIILT